jgi:hypothetical protein
MTENSRKKTLINAHTEGFWVSRYLYYPGKRVYKWFLWACEHGGSKISTWAWNKRWNKGSRDDWRDEDDPDYRTADHFDEIKEIERRNGKTRS